APQANNAQLLAKLALIEQKFELLPQLYIDQVTLSLQKQTKSLLTVIDDIKEQQADAIRVSAHSNKNRVAGNNTSSILNSVPNIPNMGIATRKYERAFMETDIKLNKLTALARHRMSVEPTSPTLGATAIVSDAAVAAVPETTSSTVPTSA
ncbi:hypothetical protein HK100_012034, partial [Physocladia obscura]